MLELACSVVCVVGCAAGREVRPAAQLLSFCFAKKKVTKEKGDPTGRVPQRSCGQPAMLDRGAALRNSLRACSAPFGQPQRVRARSRACCAARPAPRPALLGTARGDGGHTRAIAALGPVPALLPHPLAGEGWGEGAVSLTSSGCAEEHSGRGERMQRSMYPACDLTRWRCLNGAAQPRSEFDSAPRPRAPQVARSEAKGRSQWGRTSFAYFSCASKKSRSPAGARPGQQLIERLNPSPDPTDRVGGRLSRQMGEGARSHRRRP